jgi:hypothetical protein
MLNWRNTRSGFEDAGEYAMDQLRSVADTAAKSARDVSSQIESWATDGYESLRDAADSEPAAFWSAVTIGMGALVGGLFAWWQTSGSKQRRGRRRSARTMAVRSGMSRSSRSMGAAMNGAGMSKRPRRRRSAMRRGNRA